MQGIKVDFNGLKNFVSDEELMDMESRIFAAHDALLNKTGKGSEMIQRKKK